MDRGRTLVHLTVTMNWDYEKRVTHGQGDDTGRVKVGGGLDRMIGKLEIRTLRG